MLCIAQCYSATTLSTQQETRAMDLFKITGKEIKTHPESVQKERTYFRKKITQLYYEVCQMLFPGVKLNKSGKSPYKFNAVKIFILFWIACDDDVGSVVTSCSNSKLNNTIPTTPRNSSKNSTTPRNAANPDNNMFSPTLLSTPSIVTAQEGSNVMPNVTTTMDKTDVNITTSSGNVQY